MKKMKFRITTQPFLNFCNPTTLQDLIFCEYFVFIKSELVIKKTRNKNTIEASLTSVLNKMEKEELKKSLKMLITRFEYRIATKIS